MLLTDIEPVVVVRGPYLETIFTLVLAIEKQRLCGSTLRQMSYIDFKAILIICFWMPIGKKVSDLLA